MSTMFGWLKRRTMSEQRKVAVPPPIMPSPSPAYTQPPVEWNAKYSPGMIARECRRIDDFVALTSPSAWRAVGGLLEHAPKAHQFVTSQEYAYNVALLERLPRAKFVLGIGGGMALDAAKIVAAAQSATLIMIPTVVSTGSVFNAGFPQRHDGVLRIIHKVASPKILLFDTDVIRAAPAHLNAAGMAECVCWVSVVSAWQWWCQNRRGGVEWDQSVADELIVAVRECVSCWVNDVDADGRPGIDAIRACAEWNRKRYGLHAWDLGLYYAIDHAFDAAFYFVHRRSLLHSEAVALGSLLSCVLYDGGFEETIHLLRSCGTRYLPAQIGCTWPEVRETLDHLHEHGTHYGHTNTRLADGPVSDELFNQMVTRVEGG